MKVYRFLFKGLIYLLFTASLTSQEIRNTLKAINEQINKDEIDKSVTIDRFDRWAYSIKKHDAFIYFAPMLQYGTGTPENAYNLHHDFGIMYRWFMVKNEKIKINLQGWLEQTSFWAGDTTNNFSKKTGMLSSPNASTEEEHNLSLGSFYFEIFLMNEKLDITIGKFDPLFLTVFTNYAGWDKYDYFSKSASSNPVPDLDDGIGLYSEYHFSKKFSFGGLVVDNEAMNNFLYIPKFNKTTWNYIGFFRFKIPTKSKLYSDHNLAYFYQSATGEKESGSGFVYTGNQGLTNNMILILKFSNATGRVDKLNASYVGGLTFINPLHRNNDQTGFAVIVNEKNGNYEYGLDTYYRFFVNPYVNIAPNFQMYYTVNDKINNVFGLRAFISY